MVKKKKIPLRMCLGCSEMKPKKELVRIVKTIIKMKDSDDETYEISVDLTGKKAGRGAYICKDPECLKKARKSRRLEKNFSCKIEEDIYDKMEGEIRAATE